MTGVTLCLESGLDSDGQLVELSSGHVDDGRMSSKINSVSNWKLPNVVEVAVAFKRFPDPEVEAAFESEETVATLLTKTPLAFLDVPLTMLVIKGPPTLLLLLLLLAIAPPPGSEGPEES